MLAQAVLRKISNRLRALGAGRPPQAAPEVIAPPTPTREPWELWLMHPQADYFLSRGGRENPPPIVANVGLTNKCNLRCEICGSQKHLDRVGGRRHTPFEHLQSIADTLFPVLAIVELNSRGDPLLYPQIEQVLELIRKYDCDLKVQTNGTLFSDRVIDLLLSMYGEINISLDAVGPKFDVVRKGGVWAKAEPGMRKLMQRRDPEALQIALYPTMTRRTLDDVVPILDWAKEMDLDAVNFHRYVPLQMDNTEETPTPEEYEEARRQAREWCERHDSPLNVNFESEQINPTWRPWRRTKFASPEKQYFAHNVRFFGPPSYPLEADNHLADTNFVCAAPNSYIEVGLDGEISACCRSQDVNLGDVSSIESFADTWFGHNYKVIRQSMRRDYEGDYPLANCEGCINFFAPGAQCGRKAMKYDGDTPPPNGLRFDVVKTPA
jgi:MoaA/NifB/PqqE/SkfB family radical SAM enzyme